MKFKHLYGLKTFPERAEINCRTAVRAVILRGNTLLMIHNNMGDYKFAGGGVDENETLEEALRREVLEETGYTVTNIGEELGQAVQNREDMYDPNHFFSMASHYFLCEVGEQAASLSLDDYERDLDFTPVWISIEEAINNNETVIQLAEERPRDINLDWTKRDTAALKEVLKYVK